MQDSMINSMRFGLLLAVKIWSCGLAIVVPFFMIGLIKAIVSAFITPNDEDDDE